MLVVGVLYKEDAFFAKAVSLLQKKFGPCYEGVSYLFSFTDYYEDEMGSDLKKKFIVFEMPVEISELASAKVFTNALEDSFRVNGRRPVNLDPGYLTPKELVLASVKKKPYKKDIGNGIYAHTVLEFEWDSVKTFFHTFPDFRTELVQDYFLGLLKTKLLNTSSAL